MTSIGFRVEAGAQTGYGHIVRCLALADELRDRGCSCFFLTGDSIEAGVKVLERKYKPFAFWSEIASNPDVWIVDLEGGTPPALAYQLKKQCKKLVILNGVGYPDGDPGRLFADLVFYQGVSERPYFLNWEGFTGQWFEGPEWLILCKEFAAHKPRVSFHDPLRVVVAGGGSDPKDVTGKVTGALADYSIAVRAILGPAYVGDDLNYDSLVEFVRSPAVMAEALAWADIAIVSYGMTAFECLALGLPTIALSISPDHAASAEQVQERSGGALESLGEVDDVSAASILAAVYGKMMNYSKCSQRAVEFVDGLGTGRVVDKILEQINK